MELEPTIHIIQHLYTVPQCNYKWRSSHPTDPNTFFEHFCTLAPGHIGNHQCNCGSYLLVG